MLTTASAHRKDIRSSYCSLEHRHFATIAAVIRAMDGVFTFTERRLIADHFARELQGTNAKFDRQRFINACMIPEEG